MNFFKTTVYIFFILMLFATCEKNDDIPVPEDGEKATLRLTLDFEEADTGTKATPGSTAIPRTSWETIHKFQLFLCSKPDNKVVYSRELTREIARETIVLKNLPKGPHTLILLGNAMGQKRQWEG